MSQIEEILRRRTFAIISHPDAGKTTLTEKLLLFGGAIQTAGAVKANKVRKYASSDFMEIERQRGISVATSVMAFNYKNIKINLLDTPGHQDFCEDTYRTLTAVDSTVMVIDCVKGVEAQTEKLLEVCRMRKTPVITFINKLDREGLEPVDLLDRVEKELKIRICPMSWPIGMGRSLKGVYSLFEKKILLFKPHETHQSTDSVLISDLADPSLDANIGTDAAATLRNEIELISGIYPPFNVEEYLTGEVTPVFFGSAINNFGVRELLDCFISIAPSPKPHAAMPRTVLPEENSFSGFVFKIHANMDPRHRNRIAFLCVCSGKFERNKNYYHVRLNREMRFSSPTAFMAQEKNIIDEAWPGDIIGIPDTGNFQIGDTLTEGETLSFTGIPRFSPEIFKYVVNKDPLKTKQLEKGLLHLMDEGLAQMFTHDINSRKIIGVVGALQFEVITHRLKSEYGASCAFEPIEIHKACWISAEQNILDEFCSKNRPLIAADPDGRKVFLAESRYMLELAKSENPDIVFHLTSEL